MAAAASAPSDPDPATMRGIQQGGPVGLAPFALAIHGAILTSRSKTEQQHRGQLDCAAFYLDDGVVAGSEAAVRLFSNTFREEAATLGLTLAVGRCEVVPAGCQGRLRFPC